MKTAILFDLDGTLADTIEDLASAVNGALRKHGLPEHEATAYKLMVGNGFRNLIKSAIGPRLADTPLFEELRAQAAAAYEAEPLVHTAAYPGARELLEALTDRGIPFAVLSNKPDRLTKIVVRALFPGFTFFALRGETDAFPRKPDPAAAIDLLAAVKATAEHSLFLGDSDVDMRTANNARMIGIGAGWGFRGRAELLESGARAVIQKPEELLAYLPLAYK